MKGFTRAKNKCLGLSTMLQPQSLQGWHGDGLLIVDTFIMINGVVDRKTPTNLHATRQVLCRTNVRVVQEVEADKEGQQIQY